ncbi:uncharacterized protein LOC127254752 isoform X3 [Andrographis paniculata]|uniref:uncharacterized protein LOC127254752 isoform X3 n=1 Tax=Andrographis paniculata TaxID=175694 RepID=UPI0021E72415|nr:uncharacterized protein LOC127254752 isoform X3 [Andrographis paniculata]
MAQPSRAGGPANHALVEQPWFIHQTGFLASLELKDAEVRAYRTDPVQRARDTCLGGGYALHLHSAYTSHLLVKLKTNRHLSRLNCPAIQ